jgi:short-subunit dehydrogenase
VVGLGIDVAVLHPSPVASNFYKGATHSIDVLEFFKSTGTTPDTVARYCLAGIGRRVVIDQGYYCAVVRLLLKIVDGKFLSDIITMSAPSLPDYKRIREQEQNKTTTPQPRSSSTPRAPTPSKKRE